MTAQEIITALRICANDERADALSCKDCPYEKECDNQTGGAMLDRIAANKIEELLKEVCELREAAAGASEWIRTEERPPDPLRPVIVARIYEKGKPLKVEQGMLTVNGWWKVYGTNVKKVSYWMPMPQPPEEETA